MFFLFLIVDALKFAKKHVSFKDLSNYASSSFKYVANEVKEIFAATSDLSVFREFNMNETVDGALILKTFDEQRNVYNGTFDYRDLETWVNANRYPMVTEYTAEVSGKDHPYLFRLGNLYISYIVQQSAEVELKSAVL